METLDLKYDKSLEKVFNKKTPLDSDCPKMLSESTIIRVEGEVAIVLLHGLDVDPLLQSCLSIKDFYKGSRGSGLVNEARIFGFSPRMPTRNHHDYCSLSRLGLDCPKAHTQLMSFAESASDIFERHCPNKFFLQSEWCNENLLPDWVMPKSVFTSGIVNKSSQLNYHYDRGNIDGGWSCMFVMNTGIKGGNLSLPGLGITLALPHGSMVLFDGQSILHGVTPMRREKLTAERYSIVYYTLKAMKNCLSPQDEIKRAQRVRDERETKWVETRKK